MPRKRKAEPKEAMAQWLAECIAECIGEWTLEECMRMTVEEIHDALRDLGLRGRLYMELSTEGYNVGQSLLWLAQGPLSRV